MNYQEFVTAKTKLEQLRHHVKNMKDTSNYFERELSEYLEAVITVKGHALCMDVKSERQKMAKLIAGVLSNL